VSSALNWKSLGGGEINLQRRNLPSASRSLPMEEEQRESQVPSSTQGSELPLGAYGASLVGATEAMDVHTRPLRLAPQLAP